MSLTRKAPVSEEVIRIMSRGNHEPEEVVSDDPVEPVSEAESSETEEEEILTRWKAIKSSNPVYTMIPPHCSAFLPPRIDPATPKRDPIPTRDLNPDECFDTCPKIISREEWGAAAPLRQPPQVTHRVRTAMFMKTEPPHCLDEDTCKKCVKFLQTFHTAYREWDDIAYSFLIGDEGHILEGRGWGYESAKGETFCSIGYIGDFRADDPFEEPTEAMLRSTYSLIMCGVKKGFLINPFEDEKCHGNTPEEVIRDLIKKEEKITYTIKNEEVPQVLHNRFPNMRIYRALNFSCLIGVIVSIGVVIHSIIDTYEKLY